LKGVERLQSTEFKYSLGKIEKGYNNRTLYVNLSNLNIAEKPVTEEMKEKFTGGRGFDLWLLWEGKEGLSNRCERFRYISVVRKTKFCIIFRINLSLKGLPYGSPGSKYEIGE
jgi:hypothetical protein